MYFYFFEPVETILVTLTILLTFRLSKTVERAQRLQAGGPCSATSLCLEFSVGWGVKLYSLAHSCIPASVDPVHL